MSLPALLEELRHLRQEHGLDYITAQQSWLGAQQGWLAGVLDVTVSVYAPDGLAEVKWGTGDTDVIPPGASTYGPPDG